MQIDSRANANASYKVRRKRRTAQRSARCGRAQAERLAPVVLECHVRTYDDDEWDRRSMYHWCFTVSILLLASFSFGNALLYIRAACASKQVSKV